jgi:hypothetical protein
LPGFNQLALAAMLVTTSIAASAQTVSIQLAADTFKVSGWNAPRTPPAKGWQPIFSVYVGTGDVPALTGSYTVESGTLVFRPRFPLAPGVRYRAVFRAPGGNAAVEKEFSGPAKDTTRRTRVERIYPSAEIWPSNQLRVYIYFSAPMSRGEADQRIHFLDSAGNILAGVFLPGEELWDPNCQRLTMTFDPGRIKRGLTSNVAMGAPITEGKRYRLVIDSGWQDARGAALVEGFSKAVRGGPAERTPPDPRQWHIFSPAAGTAGALTVEFAKPMNYPLLLRMLQVFSGRRSIAGKIDIDRQETRWRFTPDEPWKPGDYQLVVDTAIEDLAGNHVGQAFDIDVFERVTQHIATRTVALPFSVR